MAEYEYEEENLDDFLLSATEILSDKNNSETETILESLKQHLSQIFNDATEMENFFDLISSVIFGVEELDKAKQYKIVNLHVFKLYPIIFSYNEKKSIDYLDYYLNPLDQCTIEENRADFSYLINVFGTFINTFYRMNSVDYLIIKDFESIAGDDEKDNLFKKLFQFCVDKISLGDKVNQTFGCMLLTELIEKCPLVKEKEFLDPVFKALSEFLEDKNFNSKVDLLNCCISLVFTAEGKFRPYANICLFKILDYLTDEEWIKRKLAINIVYTLVFFCKDEILASKDSIIDFLIMLKDDPVDEVRDVCIKTLNCIGVNADELKKKEEQQNIPNETLKEEEKNKEDTNAVEPEKSVNSSQSKKSKKKTQKTDPKKDLKKRLNDEKAYLDKLEKKFKANEKKKNKKNTFKKEKSKKTQEKPVPKKVEETIDLDKLINRITQIQQGQNNLLQTFVGLKEKVNKNYNSLEKRIKVLEELSDKADAEIYGNGETVEAANEEPEPKQVVVAPPKTEEQIKIEKIISKFKKGRYNDALIETKEKEKYLLELLPYITKNNMIKVNMSVLEDTISRLNRILPNLGLMEGKNYIGVALSFYYQLTKTKINLRPSSLINIKESLKSLKKNCEGKLTQNDNNYIDNIIKSLKI